MRETLEHNKRNAMSSLISLIQVGRNIICDRGTFVAVTTIPRAPYEWR